jgi:glutathione synthase/RimK-type ligase-like ATP-grasp enzyme
MKPIRLAIHHQNEPDSYSHKWVEYCENNSIDYGIVNCFDDDILEQLKEYDGLLWHWFWHDYRSQLFARQLMASLDLINYPVYPNIKTCWHYDDKLGQKYLLESIEAPVVKSYAFFDKESAKKWIESTTFPKVFKLRGGANAYNVKLIKGRDEALSYINRAFGKGFASAGGLSKLKERIWHFKRDKSLKSFVNIGRGIVRLIVPNEELSKLPIEKNYLYAQDFVEGCDHDIRVFVIGDRAVTKKRIVRKDDFRASGSGNFTWDIGEKGKECVKKAFEVTKKLQAQSVAFDFVLDGDEYKIVEISYTASVRGFPDSPGYWTKDIEWIETPLRVEFFMIEDFIKSVTKGSL